MVPQSIPQRPRTVETVEAPRISSLGPTSSGGGDAATVASQGTTSSVSRLTSSPKAEFGDPREVAAARVVPAAPVVEADLAGIAQHDGHPDLVVAKAGHDVELTPNLPVPTGGAVSYVWKQVGGTAVTFDETGDGKLRVRMPEVFTDEELVFEVALLSGGERVVQQITVQVQPVAMTSRSAVIEGASQVEQSDAIAEAADDTGTGLGKIWAALVAFFGAKQGRPER